MEYSPNGMIGPSVRCYVEVEARLDQERVTTQPLNSGVYLVTEKSLNAKLAMLILVLPPVQPNNFVTS